MFEHFETAPPQSFKDVSIHPSATVAKGAKLGKGVFVGANAFVGPDVTLHDGVKLAPNAFVTGLTTIGSQTEIFPFATVGCPPQDLKYKGERTELHVGSQNMIREYVNISVGTATGGGRTEIGDNNLIMAYCHIAHDCHIGNRVIMANGVHLAGHVTVQDNVVFGGMSGGHQFCHFGKYAMIAAGAIVVQDVPPYCMVQGDRARVMGLNVVGLRRANIRGDDLSSIKDMFRLLYQSNLTLEEAVAQIAESVGESEYKTTFLNFLRNAQRGVCR